MSRGNRVGDRLIYQVQISKIDFPYFTNARHNILVSYLFQIFKPKKNFLNLGNRHNTMQQI